MIRSRNWTAIERLDPAPGVAVMTGNGYWLDGEFHPARDTHRMAETGTGSVHGWPVREAAPRKRWLSRIWGKG
jgi:hypothetical protein